MDLLRYRMRLAWRFEQGIKVCLSSVGCLTGNQQEVM